MSILSTVDSGWEARSTSVQNSSLWTSKMDISAIRSKLSATQTPYLAYGSFKVVQSYYDFILFQKGNPRLSNWRTGLTILVPRAFSLPRLLAWERGWGLTSCKTRSPHYLKFANVYTSKTKTFANLADVLSLVSFRIKAECHSINQSINQWSLFKHDKV